MELSSIFSHEHHDVVIINSIELMNTEHPFHDEQYTVWTVGDQIPYEVLSFVR